MDRGVVVAILIVFVCILIFAYDYFRGGILRGKMSIQKFFIWVFIFLFITAIFYVLFKITKTYRSMFDFDFAGLIK